MNIMIMAFDTMFYLTMGYGVYVCWSAYKANKKKAWLLICIFCLYPFIALGVRTGFKIIFHERYQRNQQKTYTTGEDKRKIKVTQQTINLPIMQILLVIGLSFLAEEEIKREKND